MDKSGGFGFDDNSRNVRKKRSIRPRRPPDESPSYSGFYDHSSLASTPLSDSVSKGSSEENASHGASYRTENVNQSVSGISDANLSDAATVLKMIDEVVRLGESNDTGISKLKTVKLKVGGVTHTLHTKTASDGSSSFASSSSKPVNSSDGAHHMLIAEDRPDDGQYTSKGRGSRLRGIPWKDFSKSGFIIKKADISVGRMPEHGVSVKHPGNYESSRKSKRVPKRRLIGEVFDDREDNSDDEIRYLEKVRGLRHGSNYRPEYEDVDEEGSKKQRTLSGVIHSELYGKNVDLRYYNSSTSNKESKKLRSVQASEDTDYFDDEELLSDDEPEPRKKQTKELMDSSGDFKGEMAITTRQRALKSGRAYSSPSGASLIEFPNGLPPAPPKKQKEKLSEVEQQLKRAEAAQRRRIQHEKAAREAEAEAIRRILGQDSSKKKQEDKIKKQQVQLAQERAANTILSPNSVRWVIGPSGTTVTFPNEMGLPSILDSKPRSYPPPRENCAGPSCTNAYKYRDAKSKLPLCSLGCYKAIHEKMQSVASCLI